MAGITGRCNLNNPIRSPGTAPVCQFIGIANYTDVWFYYGSVSVFKQFNCKLPKKYHIECESSLPDGRITIRLFEYDAQIALDEIEFSGDVIKEIAQKYKNVQKGVGDMMSGALIETSARKLKNEAHRETALRLIKRGKQTIEEIAEDTGLSVEEIEQLAKLQTV